MHHVRGLVRLRLFKALHEDPAKRQYQDGARGCHRIMPIADAREVLHHEAVGRHKAARDPTEQTAAEPDDDRNRSIRRSTTWLPKTMKGTETRRPKITRSV